MEVMALHSKETMQFYTEIYPWVKSSYPDDETPRFVFQADTPVTFWKRLIVLKVN